VPPLITTPCEEKSFFVPGLLTLAAVLVLALGAGHVIGDLYQPKLQVAPTTYDLIDSDEFVAAFGNSRFYSDISADQLATLLTTPQRKVKVEQYVGPGWDTMQYYMQALMASLVLRPGRDIVLIETSPLSENDGDENNGLGEIRPEVALKVAEVPQTPLEVRLSVLLGGISQLYRYRLSAQATLMVPLWESVARHIGSWLHIEGPAVSPPRFEIITEPGRYFVVKEIRGDANQFREASRVAVTRELKGLRFGGYKLAALEEAVGVLRARGITVVLVETPLSDWLMPRLNATPAGTQFRRELPRVASETDAIPLDQWPPEATAQANFRDDMHMFAGDPGRQRFTRLLAEELEQRGIVSKGPRPSTTSSIR
jgi:hypothetical protein